jgi:hypothetical protein
VHARNPDLYSIAAFVVALVGVPACVNLVRAYLDLRSQPASCAALATHADGDGSSVDTNDGDVSGSDDEESGTGEVKP